MDCVAVKVLDGNELFNLFVVIMYMQCAVEFNYVDKYLFYMNSAVQCVIEWWDINDMQSRVLCH